MTKAVAELVKRGARQQAGALLNTTLKTMAASNAGTAALGAAMAVGAYPALLAGQAAYGPYTPNEQTQDARWTVIKHAYKDLWKTVVNQAWDSKNSGAALAALGRATLAGQAFLPRVGQSDLLTENEASLAGLPNLQKGLNVADQILPQVGAAGQLITQSAEMAKLAATGGASGAPISLRNRVALGVGALQPVLPLPSGREYLGQDFPMWREQMRTVDAPSMKDKVLENAGAMSRSAAPELIGQKVMNRVSKFTGSGKRN